MSTSWASYVALVVNNLPASAGDVRAVGWTPGWGRSPRGGTGNPLQYSCLVIPWTGEPGGLQSMGSQRAGHDWRYLARRTHIYIYRCLRVISPTHSILMRNAAVCLFHQHFFAKDFSILFLPFYFFLKHFSTSRNYACGLGWFWKYTSKDPSPAHIGVYWLWVSPDCSSFCWKEHLGDHQWPTNYLLNIKTASLRFLGQWGF